MNRENMHEFLCQHLYCTCNYSGAAAGTGRSKGAGRSHALKTSSENAIAKSLQHTRKQRLILLPEGKQ